MASKQLPVDIQVLRVMAHRYKWLLVILTFVSFAFSAVIVRSTISLYSASVTIFVDQENVLGDIAKGVAVATNLKDQLTTLRHLILSDDFLEPHVIQELNLRLKDVYVPPFRLNFMPKVLEAMEILKDQGKKLFRFPIYTQTAQQKQLMQEQEVARILKASIDLRQSRTVMLTITYSGPNATACKKIVEILANQCKELLLRSKNQETREALRYIERQYTEANQRLEDLERELTEMRVQLFDKTPEAKMALLQQRQEALDALRIVQKDLQELQVSQEKLIEDQNNRREVLLSGDPDTIERLSKLARTQEANVLEEKRTRLSALQQVYTDEWPEIIELNQQIASLEQTITSTVQDADEAGREKILLADPIYNEYFRQLKQIETNEAALRSKEKTLLDNINIYEGKIKEMPEFEKSFGAIQRKIDLYTSLQIDLATKRETARATMQLEKTRGENRIRIVNRSFPTKPIGMSPIVLMAGLCLVGPGIGAGIIFLLYYLNTSVKSPEDVQTEYNLPVIAIIPKTNFKREFKRHKKLNKALRKAKRKPKKAALPAQASETLSDEPAESVSLPSQQENSSTEDLMAPVTEIELFGKIVKRFTIPSSSKHLQLLAITMFTTPESQAAEEYRRLCFNVEWRLKEALSGSCKTIMVTSALPNEGKTITALNLALALARNHQVLLIDANFRNPTLNQIFGIEQEFGLSDLLEHKRTPHLFVPPHAPNLSILPAGMALRHPADLLSSVSMQEFIESLKNSQHFEYAIFDVPPVSLIPDSSIIAAKLDGIAWVIWELQTAKEVVRLSLTRLTNPAILGVVLNRSEQRLLPKKYDKVWKNYQKGAAKPRKKIS